MTGHNCLQLLREALVLFQCHHRRVAAQEAEALAVPLESARDIGIHAYDEG